MALTQNFKYYFQSLLGHKFIINGFRHTQHRGNTTIELLDGRFGSKQVLVGLKSGAWEQIHSELEFYGKIV